MSETSLQDIQRPIKGFIQERFPALQSVDLDQRTSLLEGNDINSLGLLDLVAYLEETFDIAFDDDELTPETFNSVQQLATFVAAKRAG